MLSRKLVLAVVVSLVVATGLQACVAKQKLGETVDQELTVTWPGLLS